MPTSHRTRRIRKIRGAGAPAPYNQNEPLRCPIIATGQLVLACFIATNLCAQTQVPPANPGWPCVAGRAVDPSFVHVAEATGGQVFLFDRSEATRSMVLAQNRLKHEDTIYRSVGTLSTGAREVSFPVDSTVQSLMVSVSLQCLQSVTIYRPSNTEMHGGEPDVNENRFKSGLILVLTKPEAGAWRMRIAGTGMFFAVVQAKSAISLDDAEFVELGGRPGHQGLFPIKEPLHMGPRTLELRVTAPPGDMRVRLIDSEGKTLAPIDMHPVSETEAARELVGTFDVEHPTFRLAVEGRDTGGYTFQRVLPRLFEAQPPTVIE
jgi:von Willebrand factor A domain-containing protein 7